MFTNKLALNQSDKSHFSIMGHFKSSVTNKDITHVVASCELSEASGNNLMT